LSARWQVKEIIPYTLIRDKSVSVKRKREKIEADVTITWSRAIP